MSGDSAATDRAWFQLRYIFYRIEKFITTEDGLSFENFRLYQPIRIRPISQNPSIEERHEWASIGNLTFSKKSEINLDDVNDFAFEETKQILLESSNRHLRLNEEICEAVDWDRNQIRVQLRKLNERFQKIWPDPDSFLKQISR